MLLYAGADYFELDVQRQVLESCTTTTRDRTTNGIGEVPKHTFDDSSAGEIRHSP
jgi:glycerophosphoryl diester phosphodiesterase